MTGTEKILQHIADQAREEAGAILQKAREEAQALEKAAAEKRDQMMEETERQGKVLLEETRERSQVAAETYKRRTLLAARGTLVKEALDKAYQQILEMPPEEYFRFLYTQLAKQDLGRSGLLCLNEKDLARLPEDFEEIIGEAAKKQGGTLRLSREAVPIDAGFLLDYGGIQENCSLEAIFESEADILKDAVRAVLFEG
ncbi:MAG: V-type ATP synthase subunit E [Lachnospiraceae bacterium]|nr:V-type ATP synthase subunit E [Lachnospiraceae bacterium]